MGTSSVFSGWSSTIGGQPGRAGWACALSLGLLAGCGVEGPSTSRAPNTESRRAVQRPAGPSKSRSGVVSAEPIGVGHPVGTMRGIAGTDLTGAATEDDDDHGPIDVAAPPNANGLHWIWADPHIHVDSCGPDKLADATIGQAMDKRGLHVANLLVWANDNDWSEYSTA